MGSGPRALLVYDGLALPAKHASANVWTLHVATMTGPYANVRVASQEHVQGFEDGTQEGIWQIFTKQN